MIVYDLLAECKANTGSTVLFGQTPEHRKYLLGILWLKSDAIIPKDDFDVFPAGLKRREFFGLLQLERSGTDDDFRIRDRKFQRIAQQIRKELTQLKPVAFDHGEPVVPNNCFCFGYRQLEIRLDLFHNLIQID